MHTRRGGRHGGAGRSAFCFYRSDEYNWKKENDFVNNYPRYRTHRLKKTQYLAKDQSSIVSTSFWIFNEAFPWIFLTFSSFKQQENSPSFPMHKHELRWRWRVLRKDHSQLRTDHALKNYSSVNISKASTCFRSSSKVLYSALFLILASRQSYLCPHIVSPVLTMI